MVKTSGNCKMFNTMFPSRLLIIVDFLVLVYKIDFCNKHKIRQHRKRLKPDGLKEIADMFSNEHHRSTCFKQAFAFLPTL